MITEFTIQSILGASFSKSASSEELVDFFSETKSNMLSFYPEDAETISAFETSIESVQLMEKEIETLEFAYTESVNLEKTIEVDIKKAHKNIRLAQKTALGILGKTGGTQPPYPGIEDALIVPAENSLEEVEKKLDKQKEKTKSISKTISEVIEKVDKFLSDLVAKIYNYIEKFAFKQVEPDKILY